MGHVISRNHFKCFGRCFCKGYWRVSLIPTGRSYFVFNIVTLRVDVLFSLLFYRYIIYHNYFMS